MIIGLFCLKSFENSAKVFQFIGIKVDTRPISLNAFTDSISSGFSILNNI